MLLLLAFLGTSSALQCHECIGTKSDIINPRLKEGWDYFVAIQGISINKIDSICSNNKDLGHISTCSNDRKKCGYIEFKDEEMEETTGKHSLENLNSFMT